MNRLAKRLIIYAPDAYAWTILLITGTILCILLLLQEKE